jgi:hypothetical protein
VSSCPFSSLQSSPILVNPPPIFVPGLETNTLFCLSAWTHKNATPNPTEERDLFPGGAKRKLPSFVIVIASYQRCGALSGTVHFYF